MSILDWIFPPCREVPPEKDEDGYTSVHIKDVTIGDEIKGTGVVTDKYKLLGDWVIWAAGRRRTIEKNTFVKVR